MSDRVPGGEDMPRRWPAGGREGAVTRLMARDSRGELATEHARALAGSLGVSLRTVWNWVAVARRDGRLSARTPSRAGVTPDMWACSALTDTIGVVVRLRVRPRSRRGCGSRDCCGVGASCTSFRSTQRSRCGRRTCSARDGCRSARSSGWRRTTRPARCPSTDRCGQRIAGHPTGLPAERVHGWCIDSRGRSGRSRNLRGGAGGRRLAVRRRPVRCAGGRWWPSRPPAGMRCR